MPNVSCASARIGRSGRSTGACARSPAAGGGATPETRTNVLLLVDCLTLWTSNASGPPGAAPSTHQPIERLASRVARNSLRPLRASSNDVIIVSNEVGRGSCRQRRGRVFRDEHGWLNQAVAAVCEQVFLVTAGLPLRLKYGERQQQGRSP